MKILKIFLTIIFISFQFYSFGQLPIIAVNDSLCINEGATFTFNVLTNDIIPGGANGVNVIHEGQDPCFRLDEL